jgi:hypothetical protein
MKKLLLFSMILGLAFSTSAQGYFAAKVANSQRTVHSSSSGGRNLTIIPIGHAANAYSYAGDQLSVLWVEDELNTVINIHKEIGGAPNFSGNLDVDMSTDGGATFANNLRLYTAPGSQDALHYPQGGIYNPEGNTNLAGAWYSFMAGSGYQAYLYGHMNLEDVSDTASHILPSDPVNGFYRHAPGGFHITRQGVELVTEPNTDAGGMWLDQIMVTRGLWNAGLHDFDYEGLTLPCETLPGAGPPACTRCAFAPDGQTGYIVVLGDDGSVSFSQGAFYPIVYKTTDGGASWEDPVGVAIGGPDGIAAVVYDWLTDQQLLDFFGEPVPPRDDILYATDVNCDLAVDVYGNPHIAVVIGIGDGEYSIYATSDYIAVFDITSPDGGLTWNAFLCGSLTTYHGFFGDMVGDNRVNASVTADGTKVFISWLDTHFEGMTDNTNPDIFIRGIDMVNCLMTEAPVNVTESSEAWLQAFFFQAPYYVFSNENSYTIPFTYQDMDPVDPTEPVTFMYIRDYTVADGDFVIPIDCGNILSAQAGPDAEVCQDASYTLDYATASGYTSLEWSTSGDGTFNDNTLLNPVYTPGQGDIAGGSVTLTLTAYSGDDQVSDDMVLTITPLPDIPATPEGPFYVDYAYVQSSEFTTAGAAHADTYAWDLQPDSLGTITGTTTTATANWSGAKGTAAITVTGVNACGEGEVSEAWMVTVDNTIGIAEVQDKDITIRIVPNPNNGEFMLMLASGANASLNVKIMDILGNTVYKQEDIRVNRSIEMKISLNNMREGIYFILVGDGTTTQVKKLVVRK